MSEQKKEYKIDGRPATIYRVVKNKDNPYVMVDRRPIDNPKLSYKAKGMLTYLLSRPDGWEINMTDLLKHGTDGEAKIRSGLKELKKAGHMKYTVSRNQGRITGWLIEVFEFPNPPDSDFQQVENLQVENQRQVLSKLNKNKKSSNKKDKPAATPPTPTPQEVKLYHSVVKRYPNKEVYPSVIEAIQKITSRLSRDCTAEDLQPYFDLWLTKSSNRANFSVWLLEWAVSGSVPQQNKPFGRFAQKVANVVSNTQEQFEAALREAQKLVEA